MKSSGRAQCPLSCDLEEERNGALQERGHQAEGAASAETLLWTQNSSAPGFMKDGRDEILSTFLHQLEHLKLLRLINTPGHCGN